MEKKNAATVRFRGRNRELKFDRYTNGRTVLLLCEPKDGSHAFTATINVPDEELGENEVIIKDYSENEGMLDALIQAGVVEPTGEWVQAGYVAAPVCKLLTAVS